MSILLLILIPKSRISQIYISREVIDNIDHYDKIRCVRRILRGWKV